jgi:phosphoserine aminotransferase
VNARKAKALYDSIDSSSIFKGTAQPGSRSEMNVCFRIVPNELEPIFVEEAAAAGLQALKGHRSVGGIRASIYNACPEEAVKALVDFMADFERTRG